MYNIEKILSLAQTTNFVCETKLAYTECDLSKDHGSIEANKLANLFFNNTCIILMKQFEN